MTRWEYWVEPIDERRCALAVTLDKFGEDNWELVAVAAYGTHDEPRLFFKRPLPEEKTS